MKKKRRYVCRDRNGKRVYAGDKFRVIDSSVFDPEYDECQFYWDQDSLGFNIRVKHTNPEWASCGHTTHSVGQPWCYVDDSIEKIPLKLLTGAA